MTNRNFTISISRHVLLRCNLRKHVACMRATRSPCKHAVGRTERKTVLGRSGQTHEYNIKCSLKDIVWEIVGLDSSGSRKEIASETCNKIETS